jgi:hypothetical protein
LTTYEKTIDKRTKNFRFKVCHPGAYVIAELGNQAKFLPIPTGC